MANSITHEQSRVQQHRDPRPIVWSIAASDSGGGAGIQADLNTLHSLGCHGCTIITAITAQNSLAVEKIHPISAVDLAAQWQALEKDLHPRAIKIGLLPEPSTLRWLTRHLASLRVSQDVFCVWDPVLKASTGAYFLDAFDRSKVDPLLKQTDLITPNLLEAQMLTKIHIESFEDIKRAAQQLLDRGAKSVLIKGGHSLIESHSCRDYFTDHQRSFWLVHPKQAQTNNHGTGCTLASAIAGFMSQDNDVSDSIVLANRYIQQSLRLAAPQGQGAGPVWQAPLENHPDDLSELVKESVDINASNTFPTQASAALKPNAFPQVHSLGLYAIINTFEDAARLIDQGVDTLQWRDKSALSQPDELVRTIALCNNKSIPLYINDHWSLAIELKAYGIHLGQEDLAALSRKDLEYLQSANIHLGISCHNETELAYAHSLKPSYLAFGPLFLPKSKVVEYPPLGLEKLTQWQKSYGSHYATTCIGGIETEHLDAIAATGISSIAVISALNSQQNCDQFIKRFKQSFAPRTYPN